MMRMICVRAIVLTVASVISTAGYSQPASQSCDAAGFCQRLSGDWVGTVSQSMDGKLESTRYFHAATKQIRPDTYETAFTYYRIDSKTGASVPAGVSGMASKTDTAGTITNSVTGKGDILVDIDTWKPETHELTEILSTSPTGGLQGTGSGSISVAGMPFGLGKNGKMQDYSSTWSVTNDVLKISQRFNVVFRAFLFSRAYKVTTEYTATRGSNVLGLIKDAQAAAP